MKTSVSSLLLIRFCVVILALQVIAFAAPFDDALEEGKRLLADGNAKEAVAALDKALELKPDSSEALLQRGHAWLTQEKTVRAIDDFNAVLEREPKNAAALAGRAQAHWRRGEYPQAKESAEAAIQADESNPDAHYVLGRVHLMGQFWDRDIAMRELTRTIELNPKMAWAYSIRSSIFKAREQWEPALADATKAIELEPNEPLFYAGRAYVFELMKRDPDALVDFDKSLALKPDARIYTWRGKLHSRNKRHGKAMADLNEALRLHDSFPDALLCRGFEHSLAGRMDKAERDYVKAVQAAPAWGLARTHLGRFRLNAGKPQQAIGDLNKAVELGFTGDDVYVVRGHTHFQLGHFGMAARDAREAMKRRIPGSEPHAYSAILAAQAEQRLNHPDKALKLLEVAARAAKPGSWLGKVVAFLQGGVSVDEFVASATNDGERTEAHYYAGHSLLLENKVREARTHWEWVRDNGTRTFSEYGLARAELTRLDAPAK